MKKAAKKKRGRKPKPSRLLNKQPVRTPKPPGTGKRGRPPLSGAEVSFGYTVEGDTHAAVETQFVGFDLALFHLEQLKRFQERWNAVFPHQKLKSRSAALRAILGSLKG